MRRYISVSEFQQLHPAQIQCATDKFYTQLTNTICSFFEDSHIGFYRDEIKQIGTAIALWLEDMASGTHQWEVFEKLYKQQYHRELPFFNNVNNDNWLSLQLQFIVWHSVQSTTDERVFNPENPAIHKIAQDLFHYFMQQGYYDDGVLPANQELADFLFCEETQTDFFEVKKVLIWLAFDSYFGHWDATYLDINSLQVHEYCSFHEGLQPHPALYGLRSEYCITRRCWPLSLYAKDIYAEMIRIEMDDDNDSYAQAIADIQSKQYSLNRQLSSNKDEIILEDYTGETFKVMRDSFSNANNINSCRYMLGGFAKFNNQWNANGFGSWLKDISPEEWEDCCQEQIFSEDKESNEIILERLGGKQLHFVKDVNELKQWHQQHLGIKNLNYSDFAEHFDDTPLVIFVPKYGGMSIYNIAMAICAPNNPYYDKECAKEDSLGLLADPDQCSPEMLQYLLDHNMLPDAAMTSLRGEEYGRQQVQENIHFLARCLRRDL